MCAKVWANPVGLWPATFGTEGVVGSVIAPSPGSLGKSAELLLAEGSLCPATEDVEMFGTEALPPGSAGSSCARVWANPVGLWPATLLGREGVDGSGIAPEYFGRPEPLLVKPTSDSGFFGSVGRAEDADGSLGKLGELL